MGNHETTSLKKIEELQNEIAQLNHTISIYSMLNMLSEKAGVGIIKGKFTDGFQLEFINKEALDMFGFTKEQFTSEVMCDLPTFQLFDDLEVVQYKMKKLVTRKNHISFKNKVKRRDGITIWIEGSVNVTTDKDGDKFCIFTFRFLANLQPKSKQLLNLQVIEQNIKSGILRCKPDEIYTIIYANEKFADIFGYTYEEMQSLFGSGYRSIMVPDDWAYVTEEAARQLEISNNFCITYSVIKKNGERIWIEDNGSLIVGEDEEDVMQCLITDVTSQKEREEALLISEKRHEITMNYSGIATFDYDIRSKRMTLHPSDVAEFNFPIVIDNAVETVLASGMIFPESIDDYRELYRRVEAGDLVSEAVISGANAEGESRVYELSVTNIFDDEGNQLLAVGAKKDITEKFQLQKEKEFANTLASDKRFAFEANITKGTVVSYDEKWAKEVVIENVDTSSYSNFISTMCKTIVHSEYVEGVIDYLSTESIMGAFKRGEQLISLTYRRKIGTFGYRWFENKVNIIKDELSEDINIRCYVTDVNERKEKESLMLEEQKIHKKIMSKAMLIYTVNLSRNRLLSGHKPWCKMFNLELNDNYTQFIEETSKQKVYAADQAKVRNIFLRKNIFSAYRNGKDLISCSFRIENGSGAFIWVRSTMNLSMDQVTEDLIGYSYTENIDEEKRKELTLIYKAEHDSLTDTYNKDSTEKYVTNFLATSEISSSNHAFLIIDIDHFKAINDNFGHAFGDAILSQVAGKISRLFREEDIVGRIGGDEFVVFIKNIQNEDIAIKKAQKICSAVIDVFTKNGVDYKISASVGIAFYYKHGKMYQDLYKHSDSALYCSKQNGRNQCTVYNSDIQNTMSAVNEIDSGNLIESKTFENNISEYVFKILYSAHDKKSAINSILELVGKHYNVSRAYIFEDSKDDKFTSNTFEWCNEKITPQMDHLQKIPYDSLESYMDNFNSEGIFHMPDISKIPLAVQKILEPQNVKSLLQYRIVYNSKNRGFIGFDECKHARVYEKNEIADFQRISHILGLFLLETRISEENIASKNMAISIVNGLDSYAYVCDPKTYELLFINDKTRAILPNAKIGNKCYKAFWSKDSPCHECPMKSLRGKDRKILEMYNSNLDIWVKTTVTCMNWIDGEQVCLVNCVDITEYK